MEKSSKGTKSGYSTTSKSYKAFLAHIIRKKATPTNPNLLVNLYLDCFLTFTKKMSGPTVIAAGLCEEGKFTDWRKEQKRAGNLDWDTAFVGDKPIPPEYRIGPKLAKYIKSVSDEEGFGATKGYVDMKMNTVLREFEAIKSGLDELIELFDPPVNDTKRKNYYPHPARLFKLHDSKERLRSFVEDDETGQVSAFDANDRKHPDYSKTLKN